MVSAGGALCTAVALVPAQAAGAEPWRAPAPGVAGPGADLYQIRADPLHAARPAAGRYCRRTDALAGPRTALRLPAIDEADRRAVGQEDQRSVQPLRHRPTGLGLGRTSARRAAQDRRRSGGEGDSPGPQADHRPGPGVAVHPRPRRRTFLCRCAPAAPGGRGRRLRKNHLRRTRPAARSRQRQPAQAQLRRLAPAVRAPGILGLVPPESAGDGAHLRRAGHRPRHPGRPAHRHEDARRTRGGDFLHPGVPRQLLPRRHAPRQHLCQHREPVEPAVHCDRLRHRRQPDPGRPGLPGA